MTTLIAALPMYDWPEARAETDALWARLREPLRARGIDAPEHLARRDADLPGGEGTHLSLPDLWRRSDLLLAQTCWGPMEQGLADHVRVLGQPDYSAYAGGDGPLYSSIILMRQGEGEPSDGIPLSLLRGKRLAFNGSDSMSGLIGLQQDLEALGEDLSIFSERIETGSHRASIRAVAEGRADVCAIDCRTWALAETYEAAAAKLAPVGWTTKRKGLPFIGSRHLPEETAEAVRAVLRETGTVVG